MIRATDPLPADLDRFCQSGAYVEVCPTLASLLEMRFWMEASAPGRGHLQPGNVEGVDWAEVAEEMLEVGRRSGERIPSVTRVMAGALYHRLGRRGGAEAALITIYEPAMSTFVLAARIIHLRRRPPPPPMSAEELQAALSGHPLLQANVALWEAKRDHAAARGGE